MVKEAHYQVICEDGATRHPAPFSTRREARQWAVWGHCCTRHHKVVGSAGSQNYTIG